jgi:uncharacterized protein (TIGR00369 family)
MTNDNQKMSLGDIQTRFDHSIFISTLQLSVLEVDHDATKLVVEMPLLPHFERLAGTKQFHGGPIASFIDVVGDFAVGMVLGGGVPTINLRIDFLKPAVGDKLTATAHVRRLGRTVAVVDIDIHDQRQSLVAVGRGTFSTNIG